jgi:hypothetical protein
VRSFVALLRVSALQLRYYKTRYLIMGLLLVLGSGFLFISLAYLQSIEKSLEQGSSPGFPATFSPPGQRDFIRMIGQNSWIQIPALEKASSPCPAYWDIPGES